MLQLYCFWLQAMHVQVECVQWIKTYTFNINCMHWLDNAIESVTVEGKMNRRSLAKQHYILQHHSSGTAFLSCLSMNGMCLTLCRLMLKIHFVSLVLKCCNHSLELTGESCFLGSQFCMLSSSNTLDFSANLHSFKVDFALLERRLEGWILRSGMKKRNQCSNTACPLWTSDNQGWNTMCPIFCASFLMSCFLSSYTTYKFSISSLRTGVATVCADPLPRILNCLGILFLCRVVWLLKFPYCQNVSAWHEPLLAPCLLMYVTTFISIVMSLVPVSNVMELPARCLLELQNILECSLGAAVFIKLKVLSGCSETISSLLYYCFPLLLAGTWLFFSDKSLFPFFICKLIFPFFFTSFYPSFLHSCPAMCAKCIYFKILHTPWKGLRSFIFCF